METSTLKRLIIFLCLALAYWLINRMPPARANQFRVLPTNEKEAPISGGGKNVANGSSGYEGSEDKLVVMPNMQTIDGISPFDPARLNHPTYSPKDYERPYFYVPSWKIIGR